MLTLTRTKTGSTDIHTTLPAIITTTTETTAIATSDRVTIVKHRKSARGASEKNENATMTMMSVHAENTRIGAVTHPQARRKPV